MEEGKALIHALHIGVPQLLMRMPRVILSDLMVEQLAWQFTMGTDLKLDCMRWAIRAWAEAFGFKISDDGVGT